MKELLTSTNIKNAIVWGAGSAAIIYAIKKTGKTTPLWAFLLLPTFTVADAKQAKDA